MRRPTNHIEAAMRNHGIVFFVMTALIAFGIYSLPHLNKDEFPQFTIRQGVIAAIYPGATAQEIEEQVTKPLERFLFTYQEINKESTHSVTEDGIVYVFADLRQDVTNNDEVWGKIRAGLDLFKKTSLPQGVLQIVVIDDFGNTSSMLLAVESSQRTPRELEQFAYELTDQLRTIPEMGNIKVLGLQREEVAVTIDVERLSAYGIDQTALLTELTLQGFRTIGGTLSNDNGETLIHVDIPYQSEYELGEQIVFADPLSGSTIRLKDIAKIERRYAKPEKYVEYFEGAGINNSGNLLAKGEELKARIKGKAKKNTDAIGGKNSCLIISMEMYPGNNIVSFGKKVEAILDKARETYPQDLEFHRITDQPKVVNESVISFLKDLVLSILVVIVVMLMLFPLRTALVASTGVPVCIAICFGLMYLVGIELNTVTLAALIVVLGMIVDDSVIVIDGYTDLLEKGHSSWYSASVSTKQLFIPMALATCSISGMFFPMTGIITGPLGEFVQLFPWAVAFALTASIFYAVWVIPYLSTRFIRPRNSQEMNLFERIQNRFFGKLQEGYTKLLGLCFRWPAATITLTIILVGLGGFIFTRLNVQMMPKAERACFAVEIHLTEGSSLDETAHICDSLANVMQQDKRIKSITSFVGQASPRFHATYTPQMAKKSYAQFIVNTISQDATSEILNEYTQRYENAFSNAYVRFKQMDYQAVKNPLEVYVKGSDLDQMETIADSIKRFLSSQPEMTWVHSDYDETVQNVKITLNADEASQLGISQSRLSLYLSSMMGGQTLTSIWEDDYKIPVVLYTEGIDTIDYQSIGDQLIPTSYPGVWVPLRQVATIEPDWHHATIARRNSVRTITIGGDLRGKTPQPILQHRTEKYINEHIMPNLPEGISISYGGLTSVNNSVIPELVLSVVAALLVLFVLLLYHFGKISIAVLSLSMSILCLFGACLGLWIFKLDFSITAILGVVSLIGIIVRNAIIMYEYAESLRKEKHYTARMAAFEAGLRRMRPIFLTSATTALGVIPMIIAHTSLWMPMGVVICFGTIFTLPLVVTVLPVLYWQIFKEKGNQPQHSATDGTPSVTGL